MSEIGIDFCIYYVYYIHKDDELTIEVLYKKCVFLCFGDRFAYSDAQQEIFY